MMSVDFEIAFFPNVQVHLTVPGQLSQHVIEELNSRIDFVLPGAIQVQTQSNVGLLRLSRPGDCSRLGHRPSNARSSAVRNLSFSSGVPMVTRSARSNIG